MPCSSDAPAPHDADAELSIGIVKKVAAAEDRRVLLWLVRAVAVAPQTAPEIDYCTEIRSGGSFCGGPNTPRTA